MKKRIIRIFICILFMSLTMSLLPKTGRHAQAQFLSFFNRYGFNTPYYSPILSPMIRTNEIISSYSGIYSLLNPAPPIMSLPQPVTRRFHALTTITNIKVILPPSTATVVLNPYISPLITPVTAINIPVTSTQAQPILLAAGLSPPVNPSTSYLYDLLSPSLATPSLATILPSSVVNILSIIP